MQAAFNIASTSTVPLQEQVMSEVRNFIKVGRFARGSRLPGTRELSEQLRISRNTVIIAYERLASEGFVQSREGAGTFVSKVLPDESMVARNAGTARVQRLPIDTGLNLPARGMLPYRRPTEQLQWDFQLETIDPATFPSKAWRQLLLRWTRSSDFNMTRYGAPNGLLELREAIAAHLGATRLMAMNPERIVIVTGVQQALNVVARLCVSNGTSVAVEAPGCSHARELFEHYGGKVTPVPIDDEGLMTAHLPEQPKGLALVTPTRHFPMGVSMPLERQQALLRWAERTDSYVMEVDFDNEFRYDDSPGPGLQAIDTCGRAIYAGSFSTSIGPGLRIGFLVLPPQLVEAGVHAIASLDFGFPCHGVPWLEQAVLADFMHSGALEAHLRKVRKTYMGRRDMLIESITKHFGPSSLSGYGSGTHLVWELPQSQPNAPTLQHTLKDNGVGVYTLMDASVSDAQYLENWPQIVLLGYASQTEEKIREGVAQIASSLLN